MHSEDSSQQDFSHQGDQRFISQVNAFARIYHKAWQSSTFGMVLVDSEGHILNLSQHAIEIFEQSEADLLGKPMYELLQPSERVVFMERLAHARMKQDDFTTQYFHLTLSSAKTIYFTFELISDHHSHPEFLLLLRDVTDQEKYTNALKDKEIYLNMSQKIANWGHYLLDIPSGYWISSPELNDIFGIDHTFNCNIEGWLTIIHPEDRDMMADYFINEVVGNRQPFNKEYRVVRLSDGQTRWVHGKGELRFDDQQNPVTMIGMIQDITERKLAEAELKASQTMYHDLVETSQDLVWQCDTEGRFVFLNQAWENILGYPVGEMLGKYYYDFQSPQRAEIDKKAFQQLLTEGVVRGFETCYLNKWHEPVFLVFNAKCVVDEQGRNTGIRGTAYDDTEKRRNQLLLKEKSDELDRFFNTALDMLCVSKPDGTFIRLNPEWKNVLGYDMDELVGSNFIDLVHPDDVSGTLQAVSELENKQAVFNFVNRYKSKTGHYKYIEWRSTLVGGLIYAAARDISDRIESEESLRLINKELEDSNAQKDKFLYIIAHDLRNPLSNILGFTDLLAQNYQSYSDEEAGRLLNMLNDSTHALYELIENLLNWALSKTGRIVVQPAQISLHRLVVSVEGQVHALAHAKSITVQNNVPQSATAWGDHAMMTTIFRNLISNAIKFSHPHSTISIEYHSQSGFAIVEIKDQGVGISPDVISLLFWAEEAYTTSGTQGERGTGLGLPLCKELMEKQNGHIWVESMPGQGSSFFVSLPENP